MRYIEVTVNTPADEIDARCEQLAALGAGGFVIENEEDFKNFFEHNRQYWDYVDEELENQFRGVSRIKCYLTDDGEGLAVLKKFRDAFPELTTAAVEDSDWENNWREYYKPIDVGEKLVVVPEWEQPPQNGRIPSSSTRALSSAPAATPPRACAWPRWRSIPRPESGCLTSAAAAVSSVSGRCCWAATAVSAWTSTPKPRMWSCTTPPSTASAPSA